MIADENRFEGKPPSDAHSAVGARSLQRRELEMKSAAYATFMVLLTIAAGAPGIAADYQTVEITPPHLGGMTVKFNLILPTDYDRSSRRFPVLYLLHGHPGEYSRWVTYTHITEYAKPYAEIIVMPEGDSSCYVNNYADPRLQWEDYIIKDLIPYIDGHYRTIASREGRAIAGNSMGGYGAMMLGLKYPQMFIAIASLSGALDAAEPQFGGKIKKPREGRSFITDDFGPVDNPNRAADDPFWLIQKLTPENCPHLFLSVGSSDFLLEQNRRFISLLATLGFRYRYYEVPGNHAWPVWDEQIQNVLRLEAPVLGAGGLTAP